MVKIMSGGGYDSRQVKKSTGYKTEPVSKAVSPAGANQQGAATAFKKEDLYSGKGYTPQPCGPTGVPGKYNAAKQGPGSGRTVMPSGSQSQYGPVAQGQQNRAPDVPATKPGRDILSDYGPEISGPGRRR
jgi:hypothetical protein